MGKVRPIRMECGQGRNDIAAGSWHQAYKPRTSFIQGTGLFTSTITSVKHLKPLMFGIWAFVIYAANLPIEG